MHANQINFYFHIYDAENTILLFACWCPKLIWFPLKDKIPPLEFFTDDETCGEALATDAIVDTDSRVKVFYCVNVLTTLGFFDENQERLNCAVALVMSVLEGHHMTKIHYQGRILHPSRNSQLKVNQKNLKQSQDDLQT